MRELRRLLDLNAGRPLKLCLGGQMYYFSHPVIENVEEDEKIRIEADESKNVLDTDKWSEIATFIFDEATYNVAINEKDLYITVLSMSVLAFLGQKVDNPTIQKDLVISLTRLAEEEPLLKKLIRNH